LDGLLQLGELGTYLIFQLGWLGVASAWTEGTIRELEHLKESGKVRAIGVSIHDRDRAGKLASDSPLGWAGDDQGDASPGRGQLYFFGSAAGFSFGTRIRKAMNPINSAARYHG
jgi:hypothetical protein